MFKFDFNIDDADHLEEISSSAKIHSLPSEKPLLRLEPFTEILIGHLLDQLPSLISYSPISIPVTSTQNTVALIRRDLFDARFQVIAEEDVGPVNTDALNKKALDFLDAPSDLVPGVYEGGLKTWECSLDLVEYLHKLQCSSNFAGFAGNRMLEIGCGTAMPSLYILHQLFSSSNDQARPSTQIHLQDYNTSVLELVTFPNVLLTWYTSPLSVPYRSSINDSEIASTLDIMEPGELSITPELKVAFVSSLLALNVTIRFFSGSWNAFNPACTIGSTDCYNMILTSETIYQMDSLESLVDLMQAACTGKPKQSFNDLISSLDNSEKSAKEVSCPYHCLVAAKVFYFGVGGGVSEFLKSIERRKGRAETVQERKDGVGRRVMRVEWVQE